MTNKEQVYEWINNSDEITFDRQLYFKDLKHIQFYVHKPCYVYFIKCNSAMKIGVANGINTRIKTLETGNPFPMKLYGFIETSSPEIAGIVERELHKKFKDYQISGEWFESLTIQNWISKQGFNDTIPYDFHIDNKYLLDSDVRLRKYKNTTLNESRRYAV